ncbi:MAG TPA: hypothetical protein VHF06_06230 [Pseudonocardiaceae bacterium]|nr:hypothetical protein [Pseudonocardiaceae bacterium]
MTAPPRVASQTGRTRGPAPTRETGKPAVQPDRSRSTAAERAYARRAHRGQRPAADHAAGKVERRPGSAGRVSFVVLVMVLLIGGVVATLWFSTQATADAYKLEQAKNATNKLSSRVGQLQQQVAQQDSPQSLEQHARQLGMVPAPDVTHLVVGKDGKVTVIGTPSKAVPPPPPVTSTSPPAGTTSSGSSTPPASTTATPPTGG